VDRTNPRAFPRAFEIHMQDLTRQDVTLCDRPLAEARASTVVRGLATCRECRALLPPLSLFGLPFDRLESFEAPLAPCTWNGFPVPLVDYETAVQIAAAVGDARPPLYAGLQPYDGLQWQIVGGAR
jgi:hypothetical protein